MVSMVAGPYSAGAADSPARQANLDALNQAALTLFERGHVPVVGVNMALPVIRVAGEPRYAEIMLPLSLALAERLRRHPPHRRLVGGRRP
jgi:hypothetical protein